jgi:hypothetical protein
MDSKKKKEHDPSDGLIKKGGVNIPPKDWVPPKERPKRPKPEK